MPRILIIEDEAALASALGTLTKRLGHEPVLCASAALGLEKVVSSKPALIILDIGLPDQSGLEVLNAIRKLDAALPVLIITAHGSLHNAVEAKKRGASGYLVKPLDLNELETAICALLQVSSPIPTTLSPDVGLSDSSLLIGSSLAMQPAFAAIAHATGSDAPVLITGPTGIGKSLAARVIHLHSRRCAAPFVTLSCASLPENLLESELFGHEKGSFTGAITDKQGHIERAAGGTLFLDEIAEIPPSVQVKLLRFVDEKVFSRVGGRSDLRVDLRIIAATNQDLAQAVAEKRFREDLLYRLRVLEVKLPPLHARMSDVPALSSYIMARLSNNRTLLLSEDTLGFLMQHDWPGNVRELRNVLEHAIAVCNGHTILPQHLPVELRRNVGGRSHLHAGSVDAALSEWLGGKLRDGMNYDAIHDELEGKLLAALLPRYEGKPTLLARELDMNRATLRKKLKQAGLADDEA
jgi:DNA-binding NtrC family response regulator